MIIPAALSYGPSALPLVVGVALLSLLAGFALGMWTARRRLAAASQAEAVNERRWQRRHELAAPRLHDVVWTLDPQLRPTWFSPTIEGMLGITVEDALAAPIEGRIHPDDLPAVHQHMAEVSAAIAAGDYDRIARHAEIREQHAEGHYIWVEFDVIPHLDDQGGLVELIGVTREITARKASEDRYQALYDASPVGIAIIRAADQTFIDVNEQMATQLGYGRNELVGEDVWAITPDEARAEADDVWARRAAGEMGPLRVERKFRRRDGSVFWGRSVSTQLAPTGEGGPALLVATLSDIDAERRALEEAKEREAQMQAVAENLPGMIFQFELAADGSSRFPFISRGVEDIFGVPRDAAMKDGNVLIDPVHPEDHPRLMDAISRSAEDLTPFRLIHRILRPDGALRWVETRSTPVLLPDGNTRWTGVLIDISDRRDAEQRLDEALQRQQLHVQQTPLAVIEWDTDFTIRQWNPGAERIFGYSAEEAIGRSGEILVGSEFRGELTKLWQNLKERRGVTRSVNENITRDGRKVWIDWYNTPLLDEHGNVVAVASLAADVTEQRAAEAALRQSEEEYRIIVSNVSDLIVQIDCEGRFQYVSPSYCELFGQSEQDLLGSSFLPLVHEDDQAATERAMRRVFGPPYEAEMEQRAWTIRGWRWLSWRDKAIRNAAGEVVGVVGVGRDITDQREALEVLRFTRRSLEAAQQMARLGSWSWNLQTKEIWWSDELYRIYGRNPRRGPLTEAEFYPYTHPEDRDALKAAIEESTRTGYFECEYRIRRDDTGHWRYVYARGEVSFDRDGKPYRHTGFIQDITERRQREDELVRARDLAERANRAKSDFLAMMNHELRTPLNSIVGPCEILLAQTSDPFGREMLDVIHSSSNHLLDLISEILDLAKIESGRIEVENTEVEIHRFFQEKLRPLQIAARRKSLAYEVHFAETLPQSLTTDPRLVTQVLYNLVGNAIKFTSEGGVRIFLEDAPFGRQPGLRIRVVDTGRGIPEAMREQIFEPFQQVDTSLNRSHEGTGLGLTISREITHMLGGDITVTSTEGEGSTFAVWLPLDPAWVPPGEEQPPPGTIGEDEEVQHQRASEEGADTTPDEGADTTPDEGASATPRSRQDLSLATTSRPPVLLVEDDERSITPMKAMLRVLGFECTVARSGKEALGLAAEAHPQIVLLDIRLPEMDGHEIARALRQRESAAKRADDGHAQGNGHIEARADHRCWIIAQTAFAMPEQKAKCMESGCDGYLAKPITLDALRLVLEDAVQGLQATASKNS